MIPILQQSTLDFSTWQRQFTAYASIKEWTDDKSLGALPAFVADEILSLAPWDGKATLASAMKKLQKALLRLNVPSNPLEHFEAIQFNPNLLALAREVAQAGAYIDASDETILRKFISVLPDALKMAAHQFSPDLSETLCSLTDHLSKLPMPKAYGLASITPTVSDDSFAPQPRVGATQQSRCYSTYSSRSRQNRNSTMKEGTKVVCFNCGRENHTSRFCTAQAAEFDDCGGRHLSEFCEKARSYRARSKNLNQN